MSDATMATPDRPNRKKHRLKHAVYASVHHEFSLTLCARHIGTPFSDPALATSVIDSLLWTRNQYQWLLYCYCLMPDHLHFICRLTNSSPRLVNGGKRGIIEETVLEHVGRFKSYTTSKAWKLGIRGLLWQKSSFDRVFDLDRPFQQVAEYVLENPVRRGLVKDWRIWPYSRIVDVWEPYEESSRPAACGTPRSAFPNDV